MYRDKKLRRRKKYQRIKETFTFNNFHRTTIFNIQNIQNEQKDVEYGVLV